MKKKKFRNFISNLFLLILFCIGLALIFNQQIKNWFVHDMTDSSLAVLNELTVEDVKENIAQPAEFDFDIVQSLDFETVLKAKLSDNLLTIGAIAIPEVNLNLPIFKGVSEYALAAGAGTLREDQIMGQGNYPLASHHLKNEQLLFSPLVNAQTGMLIYITDLANIYTYEITNIEEIAPSRVEVIEDIDEQTLITLITCTDDGSNRIMVQGAFISQVAVSEADEAMQNAFSSEQQTWLK